MQSKNQQDSLTSMASDVNGGPMYPCIAFPNLGFNPWALIYSVPHRGFLGLQEIIPGGQLPPLVNDQKQMTRFVS